MDAEADNDRTADAAEDTTEQVVAACETSPGNTVFTEQGNSDAWIATDLTVSPER